MKAWLTFLLPLMIVISSCQKNEYVDVVANRTILLNISPTSWRTTNGGKTYFCTLGMPEITSDFNDRGAVLTYLSFGSYTYEQLPEVYNGISYSFTHSPGQLEIDLQSADGLATITPPSQVIAAKVVLVESQF